MKMRISFLFSFIFWLVSKVGSHCFIICVDIYSLSNTENNSRSVIWQLLFFMACVLDTNMHELVPNIHILSIGVEFIHRDSIKMYCPIMKSTNSRVMRKKPPSKNLHKVTFNHITFNICSQFPLLSTKANKSCSDSLASVRHSSCHCPCMSCLSEKGNAFFIFNLGPLDTTHFTMKWSVNAF